jgi:hypothetical protein
VLNIGIFNWRDLAVKVIDLASANVVGDYTLCCASKTAIDKPTYPQPAIAIFKIFSKKIGSDIHQPAKCCNSAKRILPAAIKSYV